MSLRHLSFLSLGLGLALALAACGEDGGLPDDFGGDPGGGQATVGPPTLAALESTEVTLGETLNFFGRNFLTEDQGRTRLVFEGTYLWTDDDGQTVPERVNGFSIAPIFDGELAEAVQLNGATLEAGTQVLRWNRFGPWRVPFSRDGDRPGVFQGTVRVVNVFADGTVVEAPEATEVNLEVKSSIAITMLEPVVDYKDGGIVTPGCDGPALRAHGGLPYIMEVQAVGFQPEFFVYELGGVNGTHETVTFTHRVDGAVDRLGDPRWASWVDGEIVVFNPVPDEAEFAIASIRVTAIDKDNNSVETALPLSVVRPMRFVHSGKRLLAEYKEPVVVNGPIVGGIGTSVTYAETHSESRQQAVSVQISESWSRSQGLSNTSSWNRGIAETVSTSTTDSLGRSHSETESSAETIGAQYGTSASNSVNVSSTDGTSWGWRTTRGESSEEFASETADVYGEVSAAVAVGVSGEGSIPGLAKVGGSVETTVGSKVGGKQGATEGVRTGSRSETGSHMDNSSSESRGFGSSTTDSRSESVSGTFGLQSQRSINSQTSETAASSESTTYAMGGSEGISRNYSVGSQESWSETWVSTTTDTTLLSFSGKIPNGRCGVIYRQTVRHVRPAFLYNYDLCGVRSLAGEMYFNEWSWAPNIAVGDDCESSLPPSTQPKAACFLACE